MIYLDTAIICPFGHSRPVKIINLMNILDYELIFKLKKCDNFRD